MILQGAVDCMFEENGSLYILDFKTDRCYNKQELWERYGPQLTLYKEAMTRVMNKEVKDTVLYSFLYERPCLCTGKRIKLFLGPVYLLTDCALCGNIIFGKQSGAMAHTRAVPSDTGQYREESR